jgi:hypothetical protein
VLILAGSFPDLVSWALRALPPVATPKPNGETKPCLSTDGDSEAKANGAARGNGDRLAKRNACGGGGYTAPEEVAKNDAALLELMRANPHASLTEILRMNGRPRNSTVTSLKRLEAAGLVEHAGRGKWTVVDPDLPREKPAGWIAPLSGKHTARHSAAGRVRDELSMA